MKKCFQTMSIPVVLSNILKHFPGPISMFSTSLTMGPGSPQVSH